MTAVERYSALQRRVWNADSVHSSERAGDREILTKLHTCESDRVTYFKDFCCLNVVT